MSVTLGSNIASLRGQRQLAKISDELASVFERLSSGQRINKASDDAAGLAIADSLRAKGRIFDQGLRNINDGISLINIADSALAELDGILTRQLELAEQAANGVYSFTQRRALDEEANALVDEFNRIVESTEFNDRKIIDGSLAELRIQMGVGIEQSIALDIGGELAREVGTGAIASQTTFEIGRFLDWILGERVSGCHLAHGFLGAIQIPGDKADKNT